MSWFSRDKPKHVPKFQVGAVVQLNSGGPLMTTGGESMPGVVWCQWYSDDKDEYVDKLFDAEKLREVISIG